MTGPGLNQALAVTYAGNVNAGTATASASFAGDANLLPSGDSETFTIDQAATTTTVTCPAGPLPYTGSPIEPCTATVTGPGLNQALAVTYADNVRTIGTATASARATPAMQISCRAAIQKPSPLIRRRPRRR